MLPKCLKYEISTIVNLNCVNILAFPLTTVVSKRQPDLLTAASSKLCVITTGSDSSSVGGQEGGVYGVGFLRNDKIIYGVCQ